jgi:gas vesicle protein
MQRAISFIAGLLTGAFVGAMVAILLTPVSGENLQMQIRTRAQNIEREIRKASSERRAELEKQLAALRSTLPRAS